MWIDFFVRFFSRPEDNADCSSLDSDCEKKLNELLIGLSQFFFLGAKIEIFEAFLIKLENLGFFTFK